MEDYVKRKWGLLLASLVLCFSGYFSWCLWTISYRAQWLGWLAVVASMVTVLEFVLVLFLFHKWEKCGRNEEQWCVICITAVVLGLLLLLGNRDERTAAWQGNMVLTAWILGGIAGLFLMRDSLRSFLCSCGRMCRKHWGVCLLLGITLLLCVDSEAFQYRWDSYLYYLSSKEMRLESLSALALYGHISEAYGALLAVGNSIFASARLTMLCGNLLLLSVGMVYFYALLCRVLPEHSGKTALAMTAVYAWSPFVLGMVHYYSLDFAFMCLLPPVLYYLQQRKWILFEMFSLLFCFTKEPAIIVYGMLCVGTVLTDMAGDREHTAGKRVLRCFARKRYYLMLVPGIFWLVTYKMLGPWSGGVGGVALDPVYVLHKLQNLYLLNFNWVFTLLFLCGTVLLMVRRRYEELWKLLPYGLGLLGFTLFSCVFKTVNHPRYNGGSQVLLYLLAMLAVSYVFKKEKWIRLGNSMLAVLLLASCFLTIDPVSRLLYPTYDVGNVTVLSTSGVGFGDGAVYNRQMLGMEQAMDLALAEIMDMNPVDHTVCFPAIENNAYAFDGMSAAGALENYRMDEELWNVREQRRSADANADTIAFYVCQMPDEMDWESWEKETGRYAELLYMQDAGDETYEALKERYELVSEKTYTARGFTIRRAVFYTGIGKEGLH